MKPKSVLEVEILLWYYYSPYDINNIEAPAIQEAIDKFCKMGIMERILNQDKQDKATKRYLLFKLDFINNRIFIGNREFQHL